MENNTYTTIQGDMWDSISFKLYQNEYYMSDLLDANPQYREIVIFPAGIVLNVPSISAPIPDSLPPWKRGSS